MSDCIFCKIGAGEIPCFKVFESDDVIAFLDINPGVKGQVVLATKRHVQGVHELSPEENAKFFNAARLIILGLSQSVGCGGVNLIYSLGAAAGQRSDHLIAYLIPRYEGDKVIVSWEPKQGNPEELKQVAELIAKAVSSIPQVVSGPKKPKVVELPVDDEGVVEVKPRVPFY